MDLLKLSKKAARDPFRISNFFVLFVTIFFALIAGLSLLSILGFLAQDSNNQGHCDFQKSKKISGKVSSTSNEIYQLNFKGNNNCFLSAAFTWENSSDEARIWVYNPEGEIDVVEPTDQNQAEYSVSSPLKNGLWRFVIKGESGTAFSYKGQISVN